MTEALSTPEEPPKRGAHIQRGNGVRDAYGLTPGRRRFVKAIVQGKTATDAYVDAFHSNDRAVAASLASRLLKKEQVRKAIDAAVAAQLSNENVIANFVRRANYDPADLFDDNGLHRALRDMPEDLRKAVKEITSEEMYETTEQGTKVAIGRVVNVKLHDPIESNVHLARLLALTGFREAKGTQVNIQVGTTGPALSLDGLSLEALRDTDGMRQSEVLRSAGHVMPAMIRPAANMTAEQTAEYEAFRARCASWGQASGAIEMVATRADRAGDGL